MASDFYIALQAGIKKTVQALQSTTVTVTRQTSALQDPLTEFTPQAPTQDSYIVDAVVTGVEQDYVDGDLVQADDLQIVLHAYAKLLGVEQLWEPQITDEYSIDGKIHRANKIERVPASGPAVCYMIFVKS